MTTTTIEPTSATQVTGGDDERPVVAFFDMDKTVLSVNSAGRYARYMYRRGALGLGDILRTARWLLQYKLAIVDAQAVTRYAVSTLAGQAEAEMTSLCLQWFDEDIRRFISSAAIDTIQSHRDRGHEVVLLTAATPYIARPVSDHLSLDGVIASQLEVDEAGHFTGQIIEPLCYGAGKIHWAESWAAARNASLADCWFYTDSFTDLPMLERVGNPVVVNPDPRLKRYARRKRLPTHLWR